MIWSYCVVTLAGVVWYWKIRGITDGTCTNRQSRESRNRLARMLNWFQQSTEAVQGGGEFISGTRAIGNLSKITKEPPLRLCCPENLTQREGIMDLSVKYKSPGFRKHKGKNLWPVGLDRLLRLDTKGSVHKMKNWQAGPHQSSTLLLCARLKINLKDVKAILQSKR